MVSTEPGSGGNPGLFHFDGSLPADTPSGEDLERVIGFHVRRLRKAEGLGLAEMAERVGLSRAMLWKIEKAQTSASLATLAKLASGFGVPVSTLLRGVDSPSEAVFTRAGGGTLMTGRGTSAGHVYELLGALRRATSSLEPVLVTLTEKSEAFPRFQHPGTEFLYMLEGELIYRHSNTDFHLCAGDSLLFDGEGIHGPVDMLKFPIRFLSLTAYPGIYTP